MVLKQTYRVKSLYTHSAQIRLDAFFREFRINDDENNVHIQFYAQYMKLYLEIIFGGY